MRLKSRNIYQPLDNQRNLETRTCRYAHIICAHNSMVVNAPATGEHFCGAAADLVAKGDETYPGARARPSESFAWSTIAGVAVVFITAVSGAVVLVTLVLIVLGILSAIAVGSDVPGVVAALASCVNVLVVGAAAAMALLALDNKLLFDLRSKKILMQR
jgi:hypothetical protein